MQEIVKQANKVDRKSLQLHHPLNKVSEKLFEDTVKKLFTYTSKPPSDDTEFKSSLEPVLGFD